MSVFVTYCDKTVNGCRAELSLFRSSLWCVGVSQVATNTLDHLVAMCDGHIIGSDTWASRPPSWETTVTTVARSYLMTDASRLAGVMRGVQSRSWHDPRLTSDADVTRTINMMREELTQALTALEELP